MQRWTDALAGSVRQPKAVHVWSTPHRNRAVRNGLQRYLLVQVADAILGKQAQVQNPDKDEFIQEAPWSTSVAKTLPRLLVSNRDLRSNDNRVVDAGVYADFRPVEINDHVREAIDGVSRL